jgi:hypothetical protein
MWSAELLGRMAPEERGGARGQKLAGMCLRTLVRLRHLVEDHFLAERLAIGGIPLRIEPVRVANAAEAASARAGVAPLQLEGGDAVVNVDRALLERALETLLAFSARDDAQVRITAEPGRQGTAIAVRGAPPPEGAFRLPDRSTLSDPTGRALGLTAARAVAEAHGGSLDVVGDAYVLYLPATSAAPGDAR